MLGDKRMNKVTWRVGILGYSSFLSQFKPHKHEVPTDILPTFANSFHNITKSYTQRLVRLFLQNNDKLSYNSYHALAYFSPRNSTVLLSF